MKNLHLRLLLLIALVAGGAASPLRAQLVLSELMANDSTMLDEDKDPSDWIEIYNSGAEDVSLAGWTLSDDAQLPAKWTFPDLSLPAGRFLVVFASEKDRRDPARPLHTNFRIKDTGDYLGLFAPAGGAAVTEYKPKYPPQVVGASYGPAMDSKSWPLVPPSAPARTLIPADGTLGTTWTQIDFDDQAWFNGSTGVGYDSRATPTYASLIESDILDDLRNVNTTAYIRLPFTVDDPAAFNSLILRIRYDDGFVAYLNGTEVSRRNAPASLAWNSKAVTRRLEPDVLAPEVISLSSSIGLLKPGKNVLALQGLNDTRTSTTFLIQPELEGVHVLAVQPDVKQYFPAPTPGWANSGGLPGVSADPEFSHPAGGYADSFALSLTAGAPDAVIRYTLDRSLPTEASTVYAAPINIDKNMVVKARAFQPGLLPSRIASQAYVLLDATLRDFSSNLPILVVNTFGRTIPEDPKVATTMVVFNTQNGRSSFQLDPEYQGHAGLKIRGSSSLQFPKKSYTVELWNDRLQARAVPLLGFPRESDWILYAPYTDKTLMRDVLAYYWSNQFGRYAPHTKFVEMFVNPSATGKLSMGNYVGVYVLAEKIKRDVNRVDIDVMHASITTEPEVSGGYILKKDRLDPGDAGMVTARGTGPLGHVYPKERNLTTAQRNYIRGFLNTFETALYGNQYRDPSAGYANFIDVDSFIDQHILVEFTKNIDGYRLSSFMYKPRGGKLNMGPAWDYNLTLGNADYLDGWKPDGWYYTLVGDNDYPWYRRIFTDPAFTKRYAERWIALRQDQLTLSNLLSTVDQLANLLEEAQVRNYKKWPILGIYVWPNKFIGKTYKEEIDFMRGWIRDRVAWIDTQFVAAPVLSQKGGAMTAPFNLTLTAPGATIYYTLNSVDPRQADESLAPGALTYRDPLEINANTRLRARVKVANSWSGLTEATYVFATPPLAITEVMYSPQPPAPGTGFKVDDFEFVEIQNVGPEEMDMNGVQLTDGPRFSFTGSKVQKLPPGEFAVVVRNLKAFSTRYDVQGMNIAGELTGTLSNTRGLIGLRGPLDEPVLKFTYEASWYPDTNGHGPSLVIVNPKGLPGSWGSKESWRQSTGVDGSPGRADPEGPEGGRQIPGDLSQDGKVGLSDAIGLLRHLFLGAAVLPCEGGSVPLIDVNGDGEVGVPDAIHLLSYIFNRGAPPALGKKCVFMAGCPSACTS